MSIFSQKLIDNIIPLKNQKKLFSGILLVTFILLVRICLESIKSFVLLKQSEAFNNRIIANFQRTLFSLPKLFFDYRNEGDLIARMNDTSRIQRVISQLVGQVLADFLIVLISSGALLFYSWQATVIVLISLPFFFVLIYRFHSSISSKQRQIMSNYAVTESNYISTLQGIAVIKSFNRQSVFEQQNRTIYGNYQKSIFELGLIQLRLNGYASITGVVILMTVLSYVSYEVLFGGLKPGELMAILGITSTMLPSVSNLALLAIPINEAKIAFDRMFEFVGMKPENSNNEINFSLPDLDSVEFRNVSFRFPGRKALLNDISIKISKSEIIGVIGVSGSGKSSLVQLMERYYSPVSGQIIVNDKEDVTVIPLSQWRNCVVSVPQDVHLFNGTVLDNIVLGRKHDKEELVSFLSNQYFQSFFLSMPQGISTLVGDGGINISGGQKQWIGLMRALFQKPKLLLLDESTAAMDSQNELNVIGLLKALRLEMGILYVSHRLHTLPQLCDRIYILGESNVTACGTHQELLETENIYSQFWKELILI